jgi:glycosyltransferase involved in cell wall biosynthesis
MSNVLSIVYNELTNDNRVMNQARSLGKNGYNVTVLAVNYGPKLPSEEEKDGYSVKRVPLYYTNELIYKVRIVRFFYHFLKIQWVFLKISLKGYDIIHCHDLNTLQFGARAKWIKGQKIKLVYDAHEYERERNGLRGIAKIKAKWKESLLVRFCDRIITVSPTIAKEYRRLYSIQDPVVVLNCPVLKSESIQKTNVLREIFTIDPSKSIYLYQGYLYPGRGVEILMRAIEELDSENSVLVFLGEGTLASDIERHPLYNKSIFLHPFVAGDVLLQYTSSADVGIAFIEDISLSDRYCLPNKLFEYLAAGLPVIGSGLPDIRDFINQYKIGVTASSNDVDGFISAFQKMHQIDKAAISANIRKTRQFFPEFPN